MLAGFNIKDLFFNIRLKFVRASLPDAKKTYYLKAARQPELDIHGIASKAAVYHIPISPIIIEQGFTAAIELIYYLIASGYSIRTPLFNLRMRIPGEYSGLETTLPEGVHPVPRLRISSQFRKYLKDKVKLEIDGIDHSYGFIVEALDEDESGVEV